MEADCSQEKQRDRMSWLDGGIGLSPFENYIRLQLFSKSKWPSGGFCSSCGSYGNPGVEAEGVQTSSTTVFSVGSGRAVYIFIRLSVYLSVYLCFCLSGLGGGYDFVFFVWINA